MATVEDMEREIDRLNRLVDTLSRALARYQDEENEIGGDDPADHPYQRRGSWSHDDWCAVKGVGPPMNKTGPRPRIWCVRPGVWFPPGWYTCGWWQGGVVPTDEETRATLIRIVEAHTVGEAVDTFECRIVVGSD